MDSLVNKPFLIGVAIFITLAITSGIIVVFNSVYEIYQKVYTTDVSINSRFGDYAMYDNTVMSGLQLYNTVKKYNGNIYVEIYVDGKKAEYDSTEDYVILNSNSQDTIKYSNTDDIKIMYKVSYIQEDDDYIIHFNN